MESQDTMRQILNNESDVKISTREPTYYSFDKDEAEEQPDSAGSATIISNSQLGSQDGRNRNNNVTDKQVNLIAVADNDSVTNL